MVASAQNPEDIINLALGTIGYKLRIGSIWEGSEAATAALDCYAQTRDEVLREGQWDFARGDATLTLLKSAPMGGYIPPNDWNPATNPPPGWLFEYGYPDDCLKVRSLRQTPFVALDFDPQPVLFSVVNDNAYTPARKVIVCNIAQAILTYTRQVTNPATWNANFTTLLADTLGKKLAPSLKDLEAAKVAAAEENADGQAAAMAQG